MSFKHLKNVLSRQGNSKTKVRCLEDVLRRLGNTESTSHYLLHCPLIADKRKTFPSNIKSINYRFREQNDSTLTQTLFFWRSSIQCRN